jgi:hypothetical protein
MFATIDLSWNGEYGLYLWTGILIIVILGIAFPLTIYEQKVVKRRWQAVCEVTFNVGDSWGERIGYGDDAA